MAAEKSIFLNVNLSKEHEIHFMYLKNFFYYKVKLIDHSHELKVLTCMPKSRLVIFGGAYSAEIMNYLLDQVPSDSLFMMEANQIKQELEQ